MKLLSAIIRPHKLEDVREALQEVGVTGLTVAEVRGYGRQLGHTELYRGAEYKIEFQAKVKIEIGVTDSQVEPACDAIQSIASTGKIGDGKIFVTDLEQVIRIRTAESGEQAL